MATEGALQYSLITPDIEKNLVVQSNYIGWSILLSYIMFTKVVGPSIMKAKKPMDLQLTMVVYNSILVACNTYLAIQALYIAVETWNYRCDFANSPVYTETSRFQAIGLFALFVKFLELFDTIIFVLRKKFQQVSFLHVYHHSVVFTGYWFCLKYRLIGFYMLVIGVINFSVHVILYLYYALSALGPEVRKYLWWKKYLTTIQIGQFLIIMLYMVVSAMTGCASFSDFDKFIFGCIALITALFLNFYNRAYTPAEKSK